MISNCTYYGTIWDIAVRPELQGRGIGTRIMKKLLRCARGHRLYMVGLFTVSHNRAFHEKLGFTFFDDVRAMTSLPGGPRELHRRNGRIAHEPTR
jgi:GNAT superfamily N-acetyltransferase